MSNLPVSVVIPVRNEEANLAACLSPLTAFDDLIVVDSGSTDRTPDIAAAHDCRLIQFEWNGHFPKKRNWVLENVELRHPWVLFLDADEIVTAEVIAELKRILPDSRCNGYWIKFNNHFMGRCLKHGDVMRKLALFRIGSGQYERIEEDTWSDLDMEIHEHPVISGELGELTARIEHRDDAGMEAYRTRHAAYARWEAHRYIALRRDSSAWQGLTGRQRLKYRLLNTPFLAPLYFVGAYGLKLGFLDGRAGLLLACHKMCYFKKIRATIKQLQAGGQER